MYIKRRICFFALNKCLNQLFKMQETKEVKERILDKARDLFIEKGFKGTTIRDIATASDTNVAMVNYYFHSKYDLFEIVFEEALDILAQRIYAALTSDLPFFEVIKRWIHSYYEILAEYPQIPIFILNEVTMNPNGLTNRLKNRKLYEVYDMFAERINEEVKKGTIRETPAPDFLLNILSLSMYPFMFSHMAVAIMNISHQRYNELIENHKQYVVDFVTNALILKGD